jgi:2',3'-cyclic-nucleotide 2'-phosphodiesterase (5'-nucleotidase family)
VVIDRLREQGPILILDAGNALFKVPAGVDAAAKVKAEFLLKTMGTLGTVAMAAGLRDLTAGVEFLKKTAASADVRVLSVNLTSKGKNLFPASIMTRVGGIRVALLGVSPPGPIVSAPGVEAGPIALAVTEAKNLRKRADLVVALAAVSYVDSLQLAKEAGDAIDFVLQSHEARGPGIAQRMENNFLIPTGERGRQLGQLELSLSGKGPFVDVAEAERSRQMAQRLDQQISQTKKRLEDAPDPATRNALQETLRKFQERKTTVEKSIPTLAGRRTLSLSFANLGPDIPDDPKLKAQVAQLDVPEPEQ